MNIHDLPGASYKISISEPSMLLVNSSIYILTLIHYFITYLFYLPYLFLIKKIIIKFS